MLINNQNNRIEAFALVDRAIRLQLSDKGELCDVEQDVVRALELDPESIEVLQEAAHLYEVVIPDREKARRYAALCREKALRVVSEMDEILPSAE